MNDNKLKEVKLAFDNAICDELNQAVANLAKRMPVEDTTITNFYIGDDNEIKAILKEGTVCEVDYLIASKLYDGTIRANVSISHPIYGDNTIRHLMNTDTLPLYMDYFTILSDAALVNEKQRALHMSNQTTKH